MQGEVFDVPEEVSEQEIIVVNYLRSQEASVRVQRVGKPLPNDKPVLPTYLRSFIMNSSGTFTHTAAVVKIRQDSDTHRPVDENTTVKCRKLQPQSSLE